MVYDDDELEYEDVEDDDLYDEDFDDEEESGRGSSTSSRPNPFSGSSSSSGFSSSRNSPFNRSGSGSSSSPFNRSTSGGSSASGGSGSSSGGSGSSSSPFNRSGSSSSSRFGSSGGGSSSSSGGSSRFGSSGGGSSSSSGGSSRFGSSGGGSSSSSGGSSRFGSSGGGSSSSSGGSSRFGSSGGGSSSSSGGSSRFGSSGGGSSSSSGGSSRFGSSGGGSSSSSGGSSRSGRSSGPGSSSGLPGRGGSSSPFNKQKDDKGGDKKDSGKSGEKDQKSKDAKGEKAADGDRLSNLRNRFSNPFGGDKKDDKDNEGGGGLSAVTGALGGLASNLPFGGSSDDKDKKDEKKPEPRGNKSEKKPDSGPKKEGGSRFGSFGQSGGGNKKSAERPSQKKTEKQDEKAASAGFGERVASITSSLPFFGGGSGGDKAEKKATRQKRSKAPRVAANEGLSLDRKLDILGVGLVVGALILLLSGLSSTQGALTQAINTFFANLLGWGSWAFPATMFIIGMWLIVRHFGDEPPEVDPMRITGLGIAYIGLLVLFQYINALGYESIQSFADLQFRTSLSWQVEGSGGGWVGGQLYLLLVANFSEVGGLFIAIFVLLVGTMLIADVSVSEVAVLVIGVWRSFRDSMRRQGERRKVRRAERMEQRRAQLEARAQSQAAEVDVATSKPEQLPPGSSGALPAPDAERSIPITMGGRTVKTSLTGEPVAVGAGPNQANQGRRGLGAGLFGGAIAGAASLVGRGGEKTETAEATSQPEATENSGGLFGALSNALPFGGDDKPAEQPENGHGAPAATPSTPAQQPPTTTPASTSPEPVATETTGATSPANRPNPFQRQNAAPAAGQPSSAFGDRVTRAAKIATGEHEAVLADTAANKKPPQAEAPPPPATRADRLDALRRGERTFPGKAEEDAEKPANGAPSATREDAPARPAVVVGKTDAYGNRPTPPPSMQRPDQVKSAPTTPPGAPAQPVSQTKTSWALPDYRELLNTGSEQDFDRQFLVDQARTIEETLRSFGAPGRVVEINTGPVITQYGVEPDYLQSRSGKRSRVKVSAIAQLDRDLQLALGARSIRIEAPVPGKGYVGIEIPNAENSLVSLLDVMTAEQFTKIKSPLAIALGQSVDGTPIAADLASMPHLLIAGTTGSGKSVCINSIICSLIAQNTPEEMKFIMVDPKRVELTGYNGVPHLVAPVVVELERIVGVLKWVTREMDERYKRFSSANARNIEDFNKHLPPGEEKMPYIVVIIDELADLMMLAPEETERTITRIAALARATGIHLVIATQRPSVDVVTGLIKANFPARIAFAVAGSVDSRVILDQPGAERLLGRGDMLYLSGNSPAPLRLQGVFVSDDEIDNITRYWKTQSPRSSSGGLARGMAPMTLDPASAPRQMTPSGVSGGSAPSALGGSSSPQPAQQAFWDNTGGDTGSNGDNPDDEMYEEAVELVRRLNKASVSLLQRRLRIGYTRASRLIDMMEEQGIVGPQESGSKPREVLVE